MYTIVMRDDKSLQKTVVTTLYQGENLVDKIQFIFPLKYGDLDLSQFKAKLRYVDPGNVPHSEDLSLVDSLYKNSKLCYCVPVDSDLTKIAGNISLRIVLTKENKQLLYTGETTISIAPVSPWYQYATGNIPGGSTGGTTEGGVTTDGEGYEAVEF